MTPEAQLAADIARILSNAFAQEKIAAVHSFMLCEDGHTHLLILDLENGGTMVVAVCPGEPLRVKIET